MKVNKTVTLEKATLDISDLTITEYLKDNALTHNLMDVLKEFDGVENLTITIKQVDKDVESEEPDDKGDS